MRGQAHTVEAFVAALLVLGGVLFALNATAVTPLAASTANQHIENQEQQMAEDVLAASAADGTLRQALVHWNNSSERYVGLPNRGWFTSGGPPNAFGEALNETFADERIAFNVYVRYVDEDDEVQQRRLVYMGSPSDNAVAATDTVVLYDDTSLSGPDDSQNVSASSFNNSSAPDIAPDSPVYNVLEVKLVTWQM